MNRTGRLWIACGALLAGVSVMLAAVGDHVIRGMVGPAEVRWFELAVRYQFYHALAIMICGLLSLQRAGKGLNLTALGFLLGIVGFSGGLFAKVALPGLTLGPIIPAGATIWAISWLGLAAICLLSPD